jgi:hypothetical protein
MGWRVRARRKLSRDVSASRPSDEPDPDRMREVWHAASPVWQLELPPYDDDALLVELPPLNDTEAG